MVKAIRVGAVGGPEAMRLEEVDLAPPGPGEARIRHTAIGVNFIDVYYRSGLYKTPDGVPFTPGSEAAGVVAAIGSGVTAVSVGDRVAYAGSLGAYATERNMAADRLVPIPDGIDDRTAAAALLKGLTVQYLLRGTFEVKPEHTVLFHAGAGGVGQIAGQWLRAIGCRSITTVGTADKAAMALDAGFGEAIDYRREDFVARVSEITGGERCHVVYDSVGKDTFPGSLDCLRPRGTFVSFGNASGPVPAFDMLTLMHKGSLYATRPTLGHYTASREDLLRRAEDLFGMILSGAVTVRIGQSFPLEQATDCHRAMESRATVGSTVLTV
jgi:NADPH2:quinone reductase